MKKKVDCSRSCPLSPRFCLVCPSLAISKFRVRRRVSIVRHKRDSHPMIKYPNGSSKMANPPSRSRKTFESHLFARLQRQLSLRATRLDTTEICLSLALSVSLSLSLSLSRLLHQLDQRRTFEPAKKLPRAQSITHFDATFTPRVENSNFLLGNATPARQTCGSHGAIIAGFSPRDF